MVGKVGGEAAVGEIKKAPVLVDADEFISGTRHIFSNSRRRDGPAWVDIRHGGRCAEGRFPMLGESWLRLEQVGVLEWKKAVMAPAAGVAKLPAGGVMVYANEPTVY